jgi:hypothetical protein
MCSINKSLRGLMGKSATTRSQHMSVEMAEFGKLCVIKTRPNKSVRRSSSVKRTKGMMQNEKNVVMLTTRQGRRSKTGEMLFLDLCR